LKYKNIFSNKKKTYLTVGPFLDIKVSKLI